MYRISCRSVSKADAKLLLQQGFQGGNGSYAKSVSLDHEIGTIEVPEDSLTCVHYTQDRITTLSREEIEKLLIPSHDYAVVDRENYYYPSKVVIFYGYEAKETSQGGASIEIQEEVSTTTLTQKSFLNVQGECQRFQTFLNYKKHGI